MLSQDQHKWIPNTELVAVPDNPNTQRFLDEVFEPPVVQHEAVFGA